MWVTFFNDKDVFFRKYFANVIKVGTTRCI